MLGEVVKRLKAESPVIFKRITWFCISLITIGTTIVSLPAKFSITIPATLVTIGTNLIVAGSIGAAISKLTVNDKDDLK